MKHNINSFEHYLQIDQFMQEHSVINKELKIDDTIVCKTKDFNVYLNKLLEKINSMNNIEFIYQQWDLIEQGLKQMDIFSKFEIECIKLIVAVKYNETLLKSMLTYVHIIQKISLRYIYKLKMSYTNIGKYNKKY